MHPILVWLLLISPITIIALSQGLPEDDISGLHAATTGVSLIAHFIFTVYAFATLMTGLPT